MTEREKLNFKIANVVLNCEVLSNRLNDLLIDDLFKRKNKFGLKKAALLFKEELKQVELNWYDTFFDNAEAETVELYDVYDKLMIELSDLPLHDYANIRFMILAYKKDAKSIGGIVNKVLNK
jgi:hypothetical protein